MLKSNLVPFKMSKIRPKKNFSVQRVYSEL